jgi:hypothetical protein
VPWERGETGLEQGNHVLRFKFCVQSVRLFLTRAGEFLTLNSQDRMTKWQFWTLNTAGALCALLIVSNLVLNQLDIRLNNLVTATQNQFTQAQRVQNTAQNLIGRIAEASQKEAALRDLLVRHNFKVAQNTNTPVSQPP